MKIDMQASATMQDMYSSESADINQLVFNMQALLNLQPKEITTETDNTNVSENNLEKLEPVSQEQDEQQMAFMLIAPLLNINPWPEENTTSIENQLQMDFVQQKEKPILENIQQTIRQTIQQNPKPELTDLTPTSPEPIVVTEQSTSPSPATVMPIPIKPNASVIENTTLNPIQPLEVKQDKPELVNHSPDKPVISDTLPDSIPILPKNSNILHITEPESFHVENQAPKIDSTELLQNITQFINQRSENLSYKPFQVSTPQTKAAPEHMTDNERVYNPISIKTGHQLDKQTATLKIHPENMGTITADIKTQDGKAQLIITADNQHVKAFIESHIPQLRQEFQNAEIELTQTSVQQESSENKQRETPREQELQQSEQKNKTSESSKDPNTIIDTYA